MSLYVDYAGVGVLSSPPPFHGQRVGKEKDFWKILEAGFPALIVLPC